LTEKIIHFMLRSRCRKSGSGVGVGNFGKVGAGVGDGYFTSDSTTLAISLYKPKAKCML